MLPDQLGSVSADPFVAQAGLNPTAGDLRIRFAGEGPSINVLRVPDGGDPECGEHGLDERGVAAYFDESGRIRVVGRRRRPSQLVKDQAADAAVVGVDGELAQCAAVSLPTSCDVGQVERGEECVDDCRDAARTQVGVGVHRIGCEPVGQVGA